MIYLILFIALFYVIVVNPVIKLLKVRSSWCAYKEEVMRREAEEAEIRRRLLSGQLGNSYRQDVNVSTHVDMKIDHVDTLNEIHND